MVKKPFLASILGALVSAVFGISTLAGESPSYKIENYGIPKSLTGKPGDPVRGKKVAIHRKLGNCLACHVMPVPDQPFQGNVGPPLAGVGKRLTEAQIRLRIVDPKVFNPMTIMPSFYKSQGFHRVMKKFQGKTVLTAQQVEDVVAYLKTLK